MVLMPPGSAKSTYASMLFPAWYLARHPDHAVIAASHTAELAERFGRRVRNLIAEHSATLGVSLAADNKAAGRWETTRQGEYYAAGILGPITGRRADLCMAVGTMVRTKTGQIPIENVEVGTSNGYVLSYDEARARAGFRRVVAIARRHSDDYWRVRTSGGRVVEATADHRFYTARGWTQAAALIAGDILLSAVPDASQQGRGRRNEVGARGARSRLLQSELLRFQQNNQPMRELRESGCQEKDMLGGMSAGDLSSERGSETHTSGAAAMPGLRGGLCAEVARRQGAVLRHEVQERGALETDDGQGQSRMAARLIDAGIRSTFSARLSQAKARGDAPRQLPVRGVQGAGRSASPPHQPECFGQPGRQFGDALQDVSFPSPCGGTFSVASDVVALVERVCRPVDVVDIQVADTECFFANDLLVHNCIIDDPVKSRQEADSEIVSERIWEWWKADLSTRLKPGAKVVLIMTRWHESDLGGRVLQDMKEGGRRWELLRLPMEAENGDALGRAVGEPLWPEWFTQEMRLEAKRDARTWSALYQQAPAPDTGSYFLREWLRPVLSLPPRESLRVYGASDYAVTDNGGDYTVHVVVGIDSAQRLWLLDLWRMQAASDVWVEAFCDLVHQWKPIGWAEEQGQIRAGIGPFLMRRMRERRAYVARVDFPTRGDKSVRAQSVRGRIAMEGLHYLASAAWRTDLENEMLSFPVGKHDDQVDALGLLGQLLDRMIAPPPKRPPDEPMRGASEMTIDEAFDLANPRTRNVGRVARI